MPSFSQRAYNKELLDAGSIPFDDIRQNLKELNIINTLLGGHRVTLKGLEKLCLKVQSDTIHIVEIGCGGGDNLRVIKRWAEKKKINVQLTGVDINAECIAFAQSQPAHKSIRFICDDYQHLNVEHKPDIIFSSLFCHHFTDVELVAMLGWMKEQSVNGFFINDLHRNPIAYYSIKILTGIFSKSYLVKNDAPLSVLRGFKKERLGSIIYGSWYNRLFRHLAMGIQMADNMQTMKKSNHFDVAVIGGGLAGLALSVQLVQKNLKVVLIEKEIFPFHKVCGEYISMESWDFLVSLGVDLPYMNLPKIDKLEITSPSGNVVTSTLPLGGFGISRFKLDAVLANIAKKSGVAVMESTKVESVDYANQNFDIRYNNVTQGVLSATICCGAFGKRSNLDVKWKRAFLVSYQKKKNNYVGVKYHVKAKGNSDTIGLHNFEDGYCGFSKIEDDTYCLCYMTTAASLNACGNDIKTLENTVLSKNPALKKLFAEVEIVKGFPITISQINFSKKGPLENGIVMIGDAAGTITPLCGNGMSMALHSSKIAAMLIVDFIEKRIDKTELDTIYTQLWNKEFGNRLLFGRRLQYFFGSRRLTNAFVILCKTFPFLVRPIIRKTHGKPF